MGLQKKVHEVSKLVGAFPVSPIPTKYQVDIHEVGKGYSMCAIDALGTAFTFMQPTTLSTSFEDTKENFSINIEPFSDTIESSTSLEQIFVTYMDQSKVSNIALQQCPVINFYRDTSNIPERLKILTFEEALNSARKQFSQKAIINCAFSTESLSSENLINMKTTSSSCNC